MKPREPQPIRHYVHGDAHEEDSYSFYCASCDAFVPVDHFADEEHVSNRGAKYEQSLKNWRDKAKNYPGKYRRPTDADNWLSDEVAADRRKATAERSKFFTWLCKQSKRG